MSTNSHRKLANEIEASRGAFSLFPEAEPEVRGSSVADLLKIVKSPIYLLLMIRSPQFPLKSGQTLFANTKNSVNRPMVTMTLLDDARIQMSPEVVVDSLSAAAKLAQPWNRKKSRWPDGWETIRVEGVRPNEYISLNSLFVNYWQRLNLPIEVLLDEEKVAKYMVESNYIDGAAVERYLFSSRRNKKRDRNE